MKITNPDGTYGGSSNITTINSLPHSLFKLAGSVEPPISKARHLRSLFIIGFARSGKTTLAKRLSSSVGFSILTLDKMRESQYSDPDIYNPAMRNAFFELLLRLYPNGLIAEGDNLSGENQSRSSLQSPDDFIRSVQGLISQDAGVMLVGNADATIDEKASAIMSYREQNICWTAKANYSASQVNDLAARSISYSNELRKTADILGVTYLDIRPSHFDSDIQSGVERALALVKVPVDESPKA